MERIIDGLIDKLLELKRDHEKAKQDFIKRRLPHMSIIDRIRDCQKINNEFTADLLRTSLEEHATPQIFKCLYAYPK